MSESPSAPVKRMRLGTKSCAECRRRKVRCVYTGNNSACQECIIHEAVCAVQQPKRNAPTHSPARNGDSERLQQRLDELEGMVRRVYEVITPSSDSRPQAQSESISQHTRGHESVARPWSEAETVDGRSSGSARSTTPAPVNVREEDTPLLRLFQQAMAVQWDGRPVERDRATWVGNARLTNCVAAVNCLIPNHDDLTLILELTEHLWPIWPLLPTTVQESSPPVRPVRPVALARDFIFESLSLGTGDRKKPVSPAAAAQAILWLALCVQQLPRDFERQCPKLPTSPQNLITSYLAGGENLLAMDEEVGGGTLEGLEAISLQAKLYMNMGKPRKAWAAARRGINQALLLGLHHVDDHSTDSRKRSVWSFLWQTDRQFSLVLGFPCAIAESHPGLSIEHSNFSTAASISHKLNLIAGHIGERNGNHRKVDYWVTLKIAQELSECRGEMPAQWWETPDPQMPLGVLYGQQTIKLNYFQLQKMLHLPYMLKPSPESNFVDSRASAVEASREMVKAYQTLRSHSSRGMVIMCDVMDFQVFSAILVIIINLFSPSQTSAAGSLQEDRSRDWELVSYATATLKHVAQVMHCTVAAQAAQLLQYFLQLHHGSYTGPQVYEAVVPYFGKVRIGQPRTRHAAMPRSVAAASSSSSNTPASQTVQTASPQPSLADPTPPEVQFCTDPFAPFTTSPVAAVFSDAELNVDWTAVFDESVDYEFNQVFDMAAFGSL